MAGGRSCYLPKAGGSHATCTSLITNTARCCSSAACKASRWKKSVQQPSATPQSPWCASESPSSCSSNQKTTSNPPNTCCNRSALNKAVRNTWVQCSGLFLLHSGGHHAPAVVYVPRPCRGAARGGMEPVWDHRAVQGSHFTHEEDARAGAQPGTSVGSHGRRYLLTGGSHLKMLLVKLGGSRRDASYPKCLLIRLRKSLPQREG